MHSAKGHTMATNKEEQLKKIEEKMAQLKAQKQAIINREKAKERQNRTRRLIQNGALAEKYLGCEKLPPEQFEIFLQKLVQNNDVKELIKQNNN